MQNIPVLPFIYGRKSVFQKTLSDLVSLVLSKQQIIDFYHSIVDNIVIYGKEKSKYSIYFWLVYINALFNSHCRLLFRLVKYTKKCLIKQ